MTGPRPLAAVLCACLLGGVAGDAAAADRSVVSRPGTVLVDRAARLGELERMGPDAQRLCHVGNPEIEPSIPPVLVLDGRAGVDASNALLLPFEWAVAVNGADAFAGSVTAQERFLALLTSWAKAGAMTKLLDDVANSNTAVVFGLRRTLALLIPNWALARTAPQVDAADRALVDQWITQLVALADVNTGGRNRAMRTVNCPANQDSNNCNYHRYLRDTVNAMWGALSGDEARLTKAMERVKVALRQMRPDGSLPLETQRGSRALWHQNYALGMLIAIAEVAANQGHDLYALEIDGKNLHKGVAFLLAATAQPQIVLAYAKANVRPGPGHDWREQDLRFTEERGRWHFMAWTEAYMARFPDHQNTRRLKRLLPSLSEDRPLISRATGGNASCFVLRR